MSVTVGVEGLWSYVPGAPIELSATAAQADPEQPPQSPLLRPPERRHRVAAGERAATMVERAARPLLDRLGAHDHGGVDLLLTNTLLPDTPITGCGAEAAHRLGLEPRWILDVHNGGCAAFPYMLKLADALLKGSGGRSALICNVQNTAGQLFSQPETSRQPQSIVPGDGCGVAYVELGGRNPVLGVETINLPALSVDMGLDLADGRRYWEPGTAEMRVSFDAARTKQIVARGNELVPEAVRRLCERLEITPAEIDVLITNQPNRLFLRNWRRALGVPAERHVDTFDRFGNLYGAGAPITFHRAVEEGRIRENDLVVLAGFAHAGDFAAAAAVRWQDAPDAG